MPVAVSYPGVYIEEVPSGVRTITGVATSITAFIGRARSGPVNEPITINSYGDFERVFGGLWLDSSLGYAVRDFYQNGGSQAVVVRLFHPYFATDADRDSANAAAQGVADAATTAAGQGGATPTSVKDAARTNANGAPNVNDPRKTAADIVAKAAEAAAALPGASPTTVRDAAVAAVGQAAPLTKARLIVDNLHLESASEGTWANSLRARVDYDVLGPNAATLFNLTIRDDKTGQIEQFRNVSVVPGSTRQIDKVLLNESSLVRVRGTLPATRPAAHAAPPANESIWGNNSANSKVLGAGQASDGTLLDANDFIGIGKEEAKQGLYALRKVDLFNLLVIPPYKATSDVDAALVTAAAAYAEHRRAILLVDPPSDWNTIAKVIAGVPAIGTNSKNAALFFPRLRQPNLLRENQLEDFAPSGAVAGVIARTDATRGVWKAPAGLDATLVGVPQLSVALTDQENGQLNPLGVNSLRSIPAAGRVVWGARTLQGDDRLASEWKYLPVRRTALYIEESLYRGSQWIVFEPNDEALWAQIRLNVGAFMQNLFRQGAFQGKTPREAYLVKCDRETTTQNDINLGIVNILVGFAPLKPAEFVVLRLQQLAGQIQA